MKEITFSVDLHGLEKEPQDGDKVFIVLSRNRELREVYYHAGKFWVDHLVTFRDGEILYWFENAELREVK